MLTARNDVNIPASRPNITRWTILAEFVRLGCETLCELGSELEKARVYVV
jgi:hypothetical protein